MVAVAALQGINDCQVHFTEDGYEFEQKTFQQLKMWRPQQQ